MMNKINRRTHCRKLLAIVLAMIVSITFMPLMGEPVNAANQNEMNQDAIAPALTHQTAADPVQSQQDELIVEDIDGEIDLGEMDASDLDIDIEEDSTENTFLPKEIDRSVVPNLKTAAERNALAEEAPDAVSKGASSTASDTAGGITLKENKSTGKLTVTGSVTDDTFKILAVFDLNNNVIDYWQDAEIANRSSFTKVIDMSKYPANLYSIAAQTNGGRLYYEYSIAQIYDKPKNKKSQYEVYSKYLHFSAKKTLYRDDPDSGLYLDITAKGKKKWTSYGPLDSTNTIKKLKPNKTYQVRVYYRKNVTINGKQYYISGVDNKKYTTLTIKTGKKKLPIKSVNVKAVNIKKHTHIIPGYVLNNVGKETWYTYRLQVTVKMKKKPGVKGIYINGKKLKGNKKTYKVKYAKVSSIFTGKWVVKPYRKYYKHTIAKIPRGTKYTVAIYSYRDKTYKGYSPIQKKTTRVR